jgi:hypothetical protein
MLLSSLPSEYGSIRSALENSDTSPTLNEVQDIVIMEYQTREIRGDSKK